MTQFGSPLAASLASTPLQAQQVGRELGHAQTRQAADAKRIRQMIESHMQSLEEGDEDSVDQIRIDSQPPQQHGRQGQDQFFRQDTSQDNASGDADASTPAPAEILGPPAPDPAVIAQLLQSTQRLTPTGDKEPPQDPLYKHLDLQA
ncbi:MAG: hypothetical protein IT441_09130 [Phycisphaeraceae bacterium]|nr:hypothetical protein [Phycisphaeraceae bacterium]